MLRLLMQQDKTVFYEARTAKARAHDGGANAGSTGYEVWKWMGVASVSNPGLIPVMRDPTTWRLVDPAKAA